MSREIERAFIPARFLLAAPPPAVTVIPRDFPVTLCRAKVARGARKPQMANRGDAPTTSHAANNTGRVCGNSQHTHVRNLAARGYR